MEITAFDLAQRFVGMKEVPGKVSNPAILAMLQLDDDWPKDDEVPWCSAFVNYIAWLLRLPRSKSLAALSWLNVGVPVIRTEDAVVGFDVVVLAREGGGHVGLFGGIDNRLGGESRLYLLGGNQGDTVSLASFDAGRLRGIRRLL